MLGHQVKAAASAADALDVLGTGWPHCALLDIGLPGMDGYELARLIRSGQSNMKLVAITGYGQSKDKAKATAAGFDLHLTKPVTLAALQRALGD